MKKKHFILLILISFLIPQTGQSCSCWYFGGFSLTNQISDLVVYGKVIEYDSLGTFNEPDDPYSMRFAIIQKYRGIENRDTITIFGDSGSDCRAYISYFPKNSEWILALNKYKSDYEINICGEYFLPVKHNKAVGQIFKRGKLEDKTEVKLSELKKIVRSPSKYPIYEGYNEKFYNEKGWYYCDTMPKSNYSLKCLSRRLSKYLFVASDDLVPDDSHLILADLLIKADNTFKLEGINCCRQIKESVKREYEKQINAFLSDKTRWTSGIVNGKSVDVKYVIPILIEKK